MNITLLLNTTMNEYEVNIKIWNKGFKVKLQADSREDAVHQLFTIIPQRTTILSIEEAEEEPPIPMSENNPTLDFIKDILGI